MFRSLKTCLSGVMLSLILGFSTPVFGQQDNVNIAELKSKTQAFYDEGKYSEALNGYSILSDTYPGDAMYRYYQGVCMVKLNRDLDEAIEHLYFSSSRGVPEDSYFYLGLAYHREYNFSEAEKFFVRFEREGSRQQQKDLNVKQYINNSRSASEITAFYNPYKVLNVVFINLLDSTQPQHLATKKEKNNSSALEKHEALAIHGRADDSTRDISKRFAVLNVARAQLNK